MTAISSVINGDGSFGVAFRSHILILHESRDAAANFLGRQGRSPQLKLEFVLT